MVLTVRLHTTLNNAIIKTINLHTHGSNAAGVEAQKCVTALKRRAVESAEIPSQLRANVLQNVSTPVLSAMPTNFAIKKVVRRARRDIEVPPPQGTPPLFHQILVILVKRENWAFPVCYCLLSCKTATTYERTFQMLNAVWPNFAPEIVTVDFEVSTAREAQARIIWLRKDLRASVSPPLNGGPRKEKR
uniref:MULE domain-containing protein n=1 Tax=Globodera pallida TaxID=36090 RepID=A0A183BWK8_GLOPA